MRVLFLGTPEFAVPSLQALLGEGFDVAAVITRPDRPTGRHRSVATPSPVKRAALAARLPVLQPSRPDDLVLELVKSLGPDCSVVVAYGHLIREPLLSLPRLGSINVHASLLPALRGAAPVQHAILRGLTETGVTIMRMDAGLDTGPILHQVATPILPEETGGELSARLSELGALALVEALTLLGDGGTGITPEPQDEASASYAPKLTREDERIDWSLGAEQVARRVRALEPVPAASARLGAQEVKLFGARLASGPGGGGGAPGEVLSVGATLRIACGGGAAGHGGTGGRGHRAAGARGHGGTEAGAHGGAGTAGGPADTAVEIAEVQPAGRRRMSAQAFTSGRGVAIGDRFE